MKTLEEKLESIKMRRATDAEKSSIWLGLITRREATISQAKVLSVFNLKKYMTGAIIALVIILGGGVTVAADSAKPGDGLYGLDLAVERAKINLAGSAEKKNELRVKFAEERVAEAKALAQAEAKSSANTRDVDLSTSSVTEIEAHAFTNETTVKIEADNHHYGFITTKRDRAEIVAEIATKYNLEKSKVDSMLSLKTENRESRADDRAFLNSSNSIKVKSQKEARDFEMSLRSMVEAKSHGELSAEAKTKLESAIKEITSILELDSNNKVKIENGNFKIEIKGSGKAKTEMKDDKKDNSDTKPDKDDKGDEEENSGTDNDHENNNGSGVGVQGGVNVDVDLGN